MLNQKEEDSFYDLLLDSQVKTPVLLKKIKNKVLSTLIWH